MARVALRAPGEPSRFAFASVTALFFGWGFICANNDPLIAAVQRVFGLSYTEASEVLDVPVGTLSSRLTRGRETLMAKLGARQ